MQIVPPKMYANRTRSTPIPAATQSNWTHRHHLTATRTSDVGHLHHRIRIREKAGLPLQCHLFFSERSYRYSSIIFPFKHDPCSPWGSKIDSKLNLSVVRPRTQWTTRPHVVWVLRPLWMVGRWPQQCQIQPCSL